MQWRGRVPQRGRIGKRPFVQIVFAKKSILPQIKGLRIVYRYQAMSRVEQISGQISGAGSDLKNGEGSTGEH